MKRFTKVIKLDHNVLLMVEGKIVTSAGPLIGTARLERTRKRASITVLHTVV